MMMAATFVEKCKGTDFALRYFYHNPVFIALWAVTAICSLAYLFSVKTWKAPATMGIHIALSLMLVGALVTHLTARTGVLHLRAGETVSSYEDDSGGTMDLPFDITLDEFAIEYYPGTHAPSDFRSEVRVDGEACTISMNNIAKISGYRLYQADYDEDLQGSILAVSHDPWGNGITYAGYLLLALCMIGFFFQKDTAFRRALKRLSTALVLLAAFLLPGTAHAATPDGVSSVQQIYDSIARPMVPFMVSLTLGICLFIFSCIMMTQEKKVPKGLQNACAVLAGVLLLYLTLVIALRWVVSGNGPFAGSYSVMMLTAWLSCVMMLALYRKFPLIQPLGFILAGFTMLIASRSNPTITNLMPVLNSPLLSIHVLSMMMSYTLFGLVALNGVMGLLVPEKISATLKDVSTVILYPAVFLITFGTFIGAVWANISWGNYWAWDPKETWALVTLLVYSVALHGDSLKIISKPRNFHIYTILAILTVLITYFGVNLVLGGMHSYGG